MYERVVEIILLLVGELRRKKHLNEVDVSALSRKGYTQSEITTAFSWLFDRITAGREALTTEHGSPHSFRVLHDIERLVITPEAYGYLLQFRELGLLGNDDIEALIERIMGAGFTSVELPDMKSFLAGYLFDIEGEGNSGLTLPSGPGETIH